MGRIGATTDRVGRLAGLRALLIALLLAAAGWASPAAAERRVALVVGNAA